jgi:hypothetical protein
LHVFPYLLPYSMSYHDFLIFLLCQFSRHTQGPIVCVSHFHVFQCFLPYSRSYNVCYSFCKFFSVSLHILCPKVCVCHFP